MRVEDKFVEFMVCLLYVLSKSGKSTQFCFNSCAFPDKGSFIVTLTSSYSDCKRTQLKDKNLPEKLRGVTELKHCVQSLEHCSKLCSFCYLKTSI